MVKIYGLSSPMGKEIINTKAPIECIIHKPKKKLFALSCGCLDKAFHESKKSVKHFLETHNYKCAVVEKVRYTGLFFLKFEFEFLCYK